MIKKSILALVLLILLVNIVSAQSTLEQAQSTPAKTPKSDQFAEISSFLSPGKAPSYSAVTSPLISGSINAVPSIAFYNSVNREVQIGPDLKFDNNQDLRFLFDPLLGKKTLEIAKGQLSSNLNAEYTVNNLKLGASILSDVLNNHLSYQFGAEYTFKNKIRVGMSIPVTGQLYAIKISIPGLSIPGFF